ncbi:ATP-binding protein [Brevundimonas sp. 3P9-tot-E]|uniref:sensor histidine kinase n=1 Tax=Brevundimonas TaxID=41275 RepID=UPI001F46D612|nr:MULTISPECIES: HAMP domain-containing sensor histidine kinase [Brevundimonas]MDA0742455.1 MASE1 domain-containing protein [Pseudomonadota bacterium]MDA1321181.1 MASE1 domain-containing protein [Pseudomonadota bacterium]MDM8352704.1 MASE1 domain-containing protein [Brevundimonas diminuta]
MSRALQRGEVAWDATGKGAAPAETLAPPNADFFRQPLAPILTALGVAVLVVLAVSFARANGLVAALWGAGGVAMAAWLRGGRGLQYDLGFGVLVVAGVFAGEILAGNGPSLSVLFTLTNLLEIVLAVVLTRRLVTGLHVDSVQGLARFLTICAIAPLPSALISAGALSSMVGEDFLDAFRIWWSGHALGFAVIGVFGLSLRKAHLRVLKQPARLAEGVGLGVLLASACYAIFSHLSLPYGFLLLPLIVIAAVRFRVIGAAWALLVVSVVAIGGTMAGHGPYHQFGAEDRALLAQLLVLLGYMPILMVAALLEERDRLMLRAKEGRLRAERASAAKSRLLANVAHEIKSPIGGVIGIGELWAGGHLGQTTDSQVEMAQMLVKTARQVEALTHDLLDVARAEAGAVKVDLRPTDVRGVLEDVRRSMILLPEAAGLKIEVVADGDALVAMADSQRLTQVIGNLANNAMKYGASGGLVVLRAAWIEDRIRIEVIDRGAGLSEEKQAQLFEPFNRLGLERSTVEGHGVGLTLAKRLVELQGGDIGVISAVGQGANFWVELPGV